MALVLGALAGCAGDSGQEHVAPRVDGGHLPVRTGLAGRLTAKQHANIVLDVLQVQLTEPGRALAAGGIPQEQPSTGLFRNGADGQAASDAYPLAFGELAATVAARVDIPAVTARFAPCSDVADACQRRLVAELGRRLFRRPLSAREADAFTALYASVMLEGLGSEQASRSVLEAMLQSPAFVFRLERERSGQTGEKRYLDGFELASRLAFFLWDSAPDDELLALAETNAIHGGPAALPTLRAQVRRLLLDPRARRMTREFITDFAGTERAAFVGITPELRSGLLESMVASFDAHVWQAPARISGLFTSTQMILDPSVASLIGLTPVGDGQQPYDVSALPERVGWLTHPGFIAGFGDADVGKIVQRGVTLMVKLMCRQPAELPDGLAAAASDFNLNASDLTERQRSERRRSMAKPAAEGGNDTPVCWACHSQFEPLAYGFDRFDAAGRYRGASDAQGRALPIDGWLTDDLSVEEAARARYDDTAELMRLLAESETVQACMAEHFIAFATGRASTAVEKDFSQIVHAAQARDGGTLQAMLEAVATSELFRALAASDVAPAQESP